MKALWLKFLDWFSHRFGIGRSVIPREPVMLRPIGVVRNNVKQPRMDGWADVRSDILIREDLADALDGIEGYSHVIVIFAFMVRSVYKRLIWPPFENGDPSRYERLVVPGGHGFDSCDDAIGHGYGSPRLPCEPSPSRSPAAAARARSPSGRARFPSGLRPVRSCWAAR